MDLAWTPEKAAIARENGTYIMVPDGTHRMLEDAVLLWRYDLNILFHTGYRITGTEMAVRNALMAAGVRQGDINDVIATSINGYNYNNTMNDVYVQALADDAQKALSEEEIHEQEIETLVPDKKVQIYNALLQYLDTAVNEIRRTARMGVETTAIVKARAAVKAQLKDLRLENTTFFEEQV